MGADPGGIPADATWFVLVRHGETDFNRTGRYQGSGSDPPLNDAGRVQSAAVAEALAGQSFDALYTSPQLRARQSAAIIGRRLGLKPMVEPALAELDHGAWEGKTKVEIVAGWADAYAAAEADPAGVRRPDGDSYGDLAARLWPALDRLATVHRGSRILLVTHGGPVRLVLSRALGRPLTERHTFGVDNASIFMVERRRGRWRTLTVHGR